MIRDRTFSAIPYRVGIGIRTAATALRSPRTSACSCILPTSVRTMARLSSCPACRPPGWLRNNTPYSAQRGSRGSCFVWQRSYFHRASPNRGPNRRRLFKLSIQRNAFPSLHLSSERFSKLIPQIPTDDLVMNCLLGRYQGKKAPALPNPGDPRATPVVPRELLQVPSAKLAKVQLRQKARRIVQKITGVSEAVAYD